MSNGSDPQAILDAIDEAEDAFEGRDQPIPTAEEGIEEGGGWETQLTKACRLLDVVDVIQAEDGHYTAIIELCFGAMERSLEAYAIAVGDDSIAEFQDHAASYDRADQLGLFEPETARALKDLYSENRTESYYGGGRPTDRQAATMATLAREVHDYAVDRIREGGVCLCE